MNYVFSISIVFVKNFTFHSAIYLTGKKFAGTKYLQRQIFITFWFLKSAKLICHQKRLLRSTAKFKCCKVLFLSQSPELKYWQKRPLKSHLWKWNAPKCIFFFSFSWNLTNYDCFFRSKIFIFWMKRETETMEKIDLKREKTGRFCIKLYMAIFNREKTTRPPQVFLSETLYGTTGKYGLYFWWNFTLYLLI